jgi:hypothetical protein
MRVRPRPSPRSPRQSPAATPALMFQAPRPALQTVLGRPDRFNTHCRNRCRAGRAGPKIGFEFSELVVAKGRRCRSASGREPTESPTLREPPHVKLATDGPEFPPLVPCWNPRGKIGFELSKLPVKRRRTRSCPARRGAKLGGMSGAAEQNWVRIFKLHIPALAFSGLRPLEADNLICYSSFRGIACDEPAGAAAAER